MKKGSINPHLYRARVGYCLNCRKKYRAVKDCGLRKQKYCSRKCFGKIWVKKIRPGMKNNPGLKNELNHQWKGDNVSYSGMHRWVLNKKGRPKFCEHCGSTNSKKYEWANVDHKYKRILADYIRLCTSCHRKYDYAKKLNTKSRL